MHHNLLNPEKFGICFPHKGIWLSYLHSFALLTLLLFYLTQNQADNQSTLLIQQYNKNSLPRNTAWGLSTVQWRRTIYPVHIKTVIVVFIPWICLKTYQRETTLFEFWRQLNREELKLRANDATLQWFPSWENV